MSSRTGARTGATGTDQPTGEAEQRLLDAARDAFAAKGYHGTSTREIAAGETVRVSSNGTTRELRARLSRRLRAGVVRIPAEHAEGLTDHVQVEKTG